MKLYKRMDAVQCAYDAHDAVTHALDQLGMAILKARLAGAHPAVKGISSAAERLRFWRSKLAAAAEAAEHAD